MLEGSDPMIDEIAGYLPEMETKLRKLELNQMLSDEQDKLPAIVSVNAGSGGTEAQDWAQMIQRMLMRYAQIKGFDVELVDEQSGEEAGIKSCSFICSGDHPYGYFKSERGVHRLVRISPYDSSKRRHTSFCAVDIIPEVDDNIEIEINPADLRTDTYRAGGAGGQHINKTDSAVRITHGPTGIVVACQNQRSQHKNRDTAMKMLRSKLYELELKKRQEETDAANSQKSEISWGSQIRSYVLHPYRMVKDHRTDFESPQPDKVLNGELEEFVEVFLMKDSEKK
jgi:peptide chain release factor 2